MFKIELLNENECVIVEYQGNEKKVVIPDAIDGKIVRKIGEIAFSAVPIEKVVIPSSVKEIDYKAFHECCELSEIVFNEGLEKIGFSSFCGNNCKKIVLPNTVKEIQQYAFCDCPNLEELYIPNSVEILEESSCSLNDNLVNVTIPSRFKDRLEEIFRPDETKRKERTQPINYKLV